MPSLVSAAASCRWGEPGAWRPWRTSRTTFQDLPLSKSVAASGEFASVVIYPRPTISVTLSALDPRRQLVYVTMIRALAMLVPAGGLGLLFAEQSSFTAVLQRLTGDSWASVQAILKGAFALWLAFDVNAALSRWAENRWLWNDEAAWRWEDELAVVTGGSNGIGAMVVRELVARGLKVAVLDLEPLSDDLEEGKSLNRLVRPRTEPCRRAGANGHLLSV